MSSQIKKISQFATVVTQQLRNFEDIKSNQCLQKSSSEPQFITITGNYQRIYCCRETSQDEA